MASQRNILQSLSFLTNRIGLLGAMFCGSIYSGVALSEVRYIEPEETLNMTSWARIEISGKIEMADVSKLRQILPKAISNSYGSKHGSFLRPHVILNSPGGDVLAALAIGRELRRTFSSVMVPDGSQCYSACIFVLAGGSNRNAFGEILALGVHRPYFSPSHFARLTPGEAKKKYDAYLKQASDYLIEMGVSPELFLTMTSISSGDLRFLTRESAEAKNLLGDDPAFQEWSRAKQIEKYGLEWVKLQDEYVKCLNKGLGDFCKELPPPRER